MLYPCALDGSNLSIGRVKDTVSSTAVPAFLLVSEGSNFTPALWSTPPPPTHLSNKSYKDVWSLWFTLKLDSVTRMRSIDVVVNVFDWRHEGRGFKSDQCHWILSVLKQDSWLLVAQSFGRHLEPCVQSAKRLSRSCFL